MQSICGCMRWLFLSLGQVPNTTSPQTILEEWLQRDPQSAGSWSQLSGLLVNDYLYNWNEAKQSAEAGRDLLRRAEKALVEAQRSIRI